jgi:hypothetical protein
MGFLLRVLLWLALPVTVVGVPAAVAWLALEREPLVARMAEISAEDMRSAKVFWERYDPRRIKAGQPATVVATERQIDTAVRVGLAGLGDVKSRIAVRPRGLMIAATVPVPMPLGKNRRYANIRAVIAPSPDGLKITRVRIGGVRIPPSLALPILKSFIETFVGPGQGEEFIRSVRTVSVKNKTVTVAFKVPKGVVAKVKTVAKKVAKKVVRTAEPEAVRAYYTKLIELARRQGSNARTSLTAFVQPLFRLAGERSKKSSPIEENRAAILAMSLYFGDRRIENVVGDVLSANMRRKNQRVEHVRLDGRHDFVQHFVISAGLALASGAVVANAVGVAKEIEDSEGSSGFSFTDLAADRAGVQFARSAVASRDKAVRFQRRLSDLITERDIFPAVRDLPEGLSGSEFKRRYGDTNSRAYSRLVAEIDRRIGKINLYR